MTATAHTSSRRTMVDMGWSLGFGERTTLGLAAITRALLIVDARVYGIFEVLEPQTRISAPEGNRYLLASRSERS